MNRRRFFLSSLLSWGLQTRPAVLQVSVMETFLGSAGPSAVLVHHATEATRSTFAAWLRVNSGASIICTLPDGRRIAARIFRLNGCFGRGLILARDFIDVRTRDILRID